MKSPIDQRMDWDIQLSHVDHSDEYFLLLFDYFAERVDGDIQTDLYSQLMTRYAAVSKALEDTAKKLAHSDTLRRQAERTALLGNWMLDLATGKLEWSQTMFEITGIDMSQAPDIATFLSHVHPDDRESVTTQTKALVAGQPPGDLLYRIVMADGDIRWMRAQHMVEQNVQGEILHIYGTLQDVTLSKQTELKLELYNDHLEDLVQDKVQEIVASQVAIIHALVKLAESRDDDTGKHIERMSSYCQFLAQALRAGSPYASVVDDAFLYDIVQASPLHDIGKVGIPDSILLKPGKLMPDEFTIMKTHVTIGYETLVSVNKNYPGSGYLKMGLDIARYHHEMWDGSGYQDGLSGTDIPLAARILTLCDVYDALRSRRVYKEPFSHEKSVEVIVAGRGTHFDPVLVDLFETHHKTFRTIYDRSIMG